jgi:hypothetical protein
MVMGLLITKSVFPDKLVFLNLLFVCNLHDMCLLGGMNSNRSAPVYVHRGALASRSIASRMAEEMNGIWSANCQAWHITVMSASAP